MEMLINYVFFMYFSGEQPSFMVVDGPFAEIIDIIILIISNGMGIRVYSVLSLFMSHRLFSRYKRFLFFFIINGIYQIIRLQIATTNRSSIECTHDITVIIFFLFIYFQISYRQMAVVPIIIQYIKLFGVLFKHWFFDFIGLFRETPLKSLSSETILITGAASGLGKGLAQRLAQFGCTLILWDVDGTTNALVADELNIATKSKRIHAMKCDLTSRENIYECAIEVH
jgi:hypothetical protein